LIRISSIRDSGKLNGKRRAKPQKGAKLMESQLLKASVRGATFLDGVFDTGKRAILTYYERHLRVCKVIKTNTFRG
jgi:hypothetical protein